jgi:hypothetical protein
VQERIHPRVGMLQWEGKIEASSRRQGLDNRLGNRMEGVVEEAHERYNIRSRSERIS